MLATPHRKLLRTFLHRLTSPSPSSPAAPVQNGGGNGTNGSSAEVGCDSSMNRRIGVAEAIPAQTLTGTSRVIGHDRRVVVDSFSESGKRNPVTSSGIGVTAAVDPVAQPVPSGPSCAALAVTPTLQTTAT